MANEKKQFKAKILFTGKKSKNKLRFFKQLTNENLLKQNLVYLNFCSENFVFIV